MKIESVKVYGDDEDVTEEFSDYRRESSGVGSAEESEGSRILRQRSLPAGNPGADGYSGSAFRGRLKGAEGEMEKTTAIIMPSRPR